MIFSLAHQRLSFCGQICVSLVTPWPSKSYFKVIYIVCNKRSEWIVPMSAFNARCLVNSHKSPVSRDICHSKSAHSIGGTVLPMPSMETNDFLKQKWCVKTEFDVMARDGFENTQSAAGYWFCWLCWLFVLVVPRSSAVPNTSRIVQKIC